MSNKLYKDKSKEENKSLGKLINIALIVTFIVFLLLFVKVVWAEISYNKMIDNMVEGIDYDIEDVYMFRRGRSETAQTVRT